MPCRRSSGSLIRNLALALEFLYDHPLHLHLLAGPDYSAAMVGPTNPALLARARQTEAQYVDVHGYPDDRRAHGGPQSPDAAICTSRRCT